MDVNRAGVFGQAGAGAGPGAAGAGVAIIGFGVAGFNAAAALRMSGYDGTIRVFSTTDTRPYSPILTSYYAGGTKSYEECFPWDEEDVDELGLDIHHSCPVEHLDVAAHTVTTPHGDFTFEKCLIATGATPRTTGFPEDCGYVPLTLRTMDDAERLKASFSNPGCRRVLISGASMVALKMLEAGLNRGLEATLVGIKEHVLDMNAVAQVAARFERGLISQGVELRLGTCIEDVTVVEDAAHPLGRRLEVRFADGSLGTFDEIAVAHGMRNNLDFLDEGSLRIDRGVLVDEYMRASAADIFAAGDVVQAHELVSGQNRIVGIWKSAARQGACAGRAMAAELAGVQMPASAAYKGSIPMNTITVKQTLFISAGSKELSEGRFCEVEDAEGMTIARIFEKSACDRRLVGFNIACDVDEPGGYAYDLGAMLTMRIEAGCAR